MMDDTVSLKGNIKMWSGFCVAIGLLFFADVVNLVPETDYCTLNNCLEDRELPHIGCHNEGVSVEVYNLAFSLLPFLITP